MRRVFAAALVSTVRVRGLSKMATDSPTINLIPTADGSVKRPASKHRGDRVTPEAGRYHLHVALACPWADGALSMRAAAFNNVSSTRVEVRLVPRGCVTLSRLFSHRLFLKGLEDSISYSVVHPTWQRTRPDDPSDTHCGWVYRAPGDEPLKNPLGHGSFDCDDALIPDPSGAVSIRDVYAACGDETGPFTTPALFDKKTGTLVTNESMDILKLLNKDFDALAKHPERNFYPEALDEDLKALNEATVYPSINNGVYDPVSTVLPRRASRYRHRYRCGMAKSQAAYDKAVGELFGALEDVNERLGKSRFLGGDKFSWLDLYTTPASTPRPLLSRVDAGASSTRWCASTPFAAARHSTCALDARRGGPPQVYTCYFKTNVKLIKEHEHLLGFMRDVYQSIEPVRRSVNMKHIKMHYYTPVAARMPFLDARRGRAQVARAPRPQHVWHHPRVGRARPFGAPRPRPRGRHLLRVRRA